MSEKLLFTRNRIRPWANKLHDISVTDIESQWGKYCLTPLDIPNVNVDGISSYMFYENRDGYNFISLHSLYAGTPVQDFIFDNYERTETNVGDTIKDVEQDFKRILTMNIPEGFDFIQRLSKGMFTSNLTLLIFLLPSI